MVEAPILSARAHTSAPETATEYRSKRARERATLVTSHRHGNCTMSFNPIRPQTNSFSTISTIKAENRLETIKDFCRFVPKGDYRRGYLLTHIQHKPGRCRCVMRMHLLCTQLLRVFYAHMHTLVHTFCSLVKCQSARVLYYYN